MVRVVMETKTGDSVVTTVIEADTVNDAITMVREALSAEQRALVRFTLAGPDARPWPEVPRG